MHKYGIRVNFAKNILNNLTKQSKSINFSKALCPDQIVGEVVKSQNGDFLLQSSRILKRQPITSTAPNYCVDYSAISRDDYIIFILESPHIKEYDANGNPVGPACGTKKGETGYDIEQYLNGVLKKSPLFIGQLRRKKYKLVLLNAVQYQASAGIHPLNKKFKEKCWLSFWHSGFKKDLVDRVSAFVSASNECHIVNLCTIGLNGLHFRVNAELKELSISFFEGYHPSVNWTSKGKRMIY